MAIGKSTVKAPIGMRHSWWFPIKEEPEKAHPIYDGKMIDMGAAVKGYLSVTTASAEIPGDDISQLYTEKFVSAQLDVETTMSDLEVNATLYGHTYSEEAGEVSSSDDTPPNGGYGMIEPLLLKDKKTIFRASCFYKTTAMPSSEKQEADTKKPGELSPKNNAVSLKVTEDNKNAWRVRKDFESLAAAEDFVKTTFGVTSGTTE